MTIESATGTEFLHIVIPLGLLLFAAKIERGTYLLKKKLRAVF
jgi:hypothetical protein